MPMVSTYEISKYEVAARHPDGRQFLVGYTPRKSRPGLLATMRGVGQQLIDKLPIGETDEMTFATKPTIHANVSGWWIGFTGRAKKIAKQDGEHPWIGDPQGRSPDAIVNREKAA